MNVSTSNDEEPKTWSHSDWGTTVPVDCLLADARPDDYAALILPGGVMNPDQLRMDSAACAFAAAFVTAGKPIAAICHGPWLLIEAGSVKGRRMTSWPSLNLNDAFEITGGAETLRPEEDTEIEVFTKLVEALYFLTSFKLCVSAPPVNSNAVSRLKSDLTNAGATWVDQSVVVDQQLVTSRKPDDIPVFNAELIRLIGAPLQSHP